jgi:hypothetical protein
MSTLAQVIYIGMDDHGTSNDTSVTIQADKRIGDVQFSNAITSGCNIAKISSMTCTYTRMSIGFG